MAGSTLGESTWSDTLFLISEIVLFPECLCLLAFLLSVTGISMLYCWFLCCLHSQALMLRPSGFLSLAVASRWMYSNKSLVTLFLCDSGGNSITGGARGSNREGC